MFRAGRHLRFSVRSVYLVHDSTPKRTPARRVRCYLTAVAESFFVFDRVADEPRGDILLKGIRTGYVFLHVHFEKALSNLGARGIIYSHRHISRFIPG